MPGISMLAQQETVDLVDKLTRRIEGVSENCLSLLHSLMIANPELSLVVVQTSFGLRWSKS